MDLGEVFSSESEENQNSYNSSGKETINTEKTKTKGIKKYYEPINDGGKVYKYEDNPSEYKKLRK